MQKILSLGIPLMISQLISMALVATDVAMMAHLSVLDLAGGGLGASLFALVFLVVSSIVGCSANLMAMAFGRYHHSPTEQKQAIGKLIKGGVLLSVILSSFVVFALSFVAPFFILTGQSVATTNIAMAYLGTLKWSVLPTILLLILRALTGTYGQTRSILIMSIATVVINIPISYLLAFHWQMGITGLGLGTTLSACLVLFGYGFWVFAQPQFTPLAPWHSVEQYSLSLVTPLLKMGLPIAIAALLENGLIFGATFMAGSISIAALALHQVLLQCLSFTWNINFGLAQAAAILAGKSYGAGQMDQIKKTAMNSFTLVTLVSVILCSVFMTFPDIIRWVFQIEPHSEMHQLLNTSLWVVALCFVVDAWQLLAINLLRGMNIVLGPTVMTAIGYCGFGLPAAAMLMQGYGLVGLWAGIAIGLALTAVLLIARMLFFFMHSPKGQIQTAQPD
ncbi:MULTISPECIES: MATE family efflux transporter [unclassified Vibrio]|uniref:MATE family efflux transporter n=1 Tax=Vibrio sp. HB236076 TaxID=3232307 RepID=A0AB39HCS7_9VIBR|nr:MATE family efflux transporter [Vibrio sp. HB161653]MDP5254110.1 MATE family efflux transporter [Vibrio sp. HB161653]